MRKTCLQTCISCVRPPSAPAYCGPGDVSHLLTGPRCAAHGPDLCPSGGLSAIVLPVHCVKLHLITHGRPLLGNYSLESSFVLKLQYKSLALNQKLRGKIKKREKKEKKREKKRKKEKKIKIEISKNKKRNFECAL